jgi:hypothetical protein
MSTTRTQTTIDDTARTAESAEATTPLEERVSLAEITDVLGHKTLTTVRRS